ncbi:site-specific DNA-methyltransferase [Succinivibrio faecicola]|uniref:site-specific DNA-methyltransferase (adenine-specific) n=1 Tax=Succinivibrio faecicola TaxID=2820300 RepID=A0ABS7DDX6_9GAMM|nr:site-specific DNA-methyltransferase [Succinivibrio faecicola]
MDERILEPENLTLLTKLINQAETPKEAIEIAKLGTSYKRTGFHFDKKIEKLGNTIKYFKKNVELSFVQKDAKNTHKLIIGDNFDALQNLLITYKNKIDVIYIDPPYGKDDMGEFAATNYNNAITRDNLLSMLYPRLILARQLLSDEGVIFCSIDDKNQAYLKCMMDEIFNEENFISCAFVLDNLKGKTNDNFITSVGHNMVVYAKNKNNLNSLGGFNKTPNVFGGRSSDKYDKEDEKGPYSLIGIKKTGQSKYREDRPSMFFPILVKNSEIFLITDEEFSQLYNTNIKKFDDEFLEMLIKQYEKDGYEVILPLEEKTGKYLRWTFSFNIGFKEKKLNGSLVYMNGNIYEKNRPDDKEMFERNVLGVQKSLFYKASYSNGTQDFDKVMGSNKFDFPKPIELIKDIFKLIKNKEQCIILDFFAGSGTTGQALLEFNNENHTKWQFILCQSNEITERTPQGIAYEVTSKRLKRVMTGSCYDGSNDFEWIKKNDPLGDNLDVYEIAEVSNSEQSSGKTPFDVIDETLYGQPRLLPNEKIEWVCKNFEHTQKILVDAKTK